MLTNEAIGRTSDGPVELADATGRVLGVFYPAADHDRLQSRIATLKHGFDEWCRAAVPIEELVREKHQHSVEMTAEELLGFAERLASELPDRPG